MKRLIVKFIRLSGLIAATMALCGAGEEASQTALKPFQAGSASESSINLKGPWRFKTDPSFKKGEDGAAHDDWEKPGFDDSSWGTMELGRSWESQGLSYDGVAWFRQSVVIPPEWKGRPLGLRLGSPDDKAEVYVNGSSLGLFEFGSKIAIVPPGGLIRFGEPNCIAIRVRDWHKDGGIYGENISADCAGDFKTPRESKTSSKKSRLDISGLWRFLPCPEEGGCPEGWMKPSFNDSSWGALYDTVPWASAGLALERAGLYRQNVFIPEGWRGVPTFLALGSIEAGDEAYFNGVRIGGITGKYPFKNKKDRRYGVPLGSINYGGMNCVAVKIDGSFSELKKTCLSEKGVCIEADPESPLMRWRGEGPGIPAESFDISLCQQGKDVDLLKPLPDGTDGQPEFSVSDLYGNLIKAGKGRIEKSQGGSPLCVMELDAAESRALYCRGALELKLKIAGGSKAASFADKVDYLDYHGRDMKELPPLEKRYDETPYGKLKLVDEIDPSLPPESEIHPYIESGFAKSLAHNSPGSPVDVEVKEILGRKCREVSDGWFAYRIGRGRIKPHKEYLVRIEYPEDVRRYACVEMQTGFNFMDIGWKNGLGPDDPYDNYPLSNSFQSFDAVVLTDDRTYGGGGAESAPADFGFWIFFMDKGRKSSPPGYKAGPAVASVKLYEIDWERNSPNIVKPQGFPGRTLMVDWERQPQNSPWDMVRYCRLMGYSAVAPCILKWHLGAYFPAGSGYNRHRAAERDIYPQYLASCLKAGVDLIPRIEYGGSLNLPEEAKSIGVDGKYAKPNRYGDWGANILHPATWDDLSALIDELIASHKDNARLSGMLWRVRCDRIQPSYSRRDVELFCKESGKEPPKAKSDKDIAKWASTGAAGKAYDAWWQGKLFEFHKKIRDRLAGIRADMKFLYYHWDSDKFSLGPYDWFSAKNWGDVSKKGAEAVYAEHLKRRSELKGPDYVNMIRSGVLGYSLKDCLHLSLNCDLYRREKGILLFAPANYRFLSDCPEYLDFFRTAEGLAVSDQMTYDEHAGRSINPKYETTMVLPAGPAYSMANEVLACFNADPVALSYTSYTYGRGFADAHRRFAKAFLALPAIEGKVLPGTVSPSSPDVKARLYEDPASAYLGVVNRGFGPVECSASIPGEWKPSAVHDFVEEQDIPAKIDGGKLVFKFKMGPMELRSFKLPK